MTGLLQLQTQLSSLTANSGTYELMDADQQQDMNRMEAKFVVPHSEAIELCKTLLTHCDCLQVAGSKTLGYDTIYFDTPDFEFYRHHHQQKPRRLKVRIRHYRETDTRFLEVKRKDKVGKTHKERIEVEGCNDIGKHAAFLKCQGINSQQLLKTLDVKYERISLRDRNNGERVSIDFGVHFKNTRKSAAINDMAIVELKLPAHIHQALAFSEIKRLGYREISISKYCIGMAHLFPEQVKYNRFKPVLMKLGLMKTNELGAVC